ncbi:hypothetical protein TWF225_010551 [Orbilia oligospora]|uniref:Clr5 domain-containing protein n=1 Tax=Orbilia oligospora TaxID=2813651 RepID=A0A8H2EBU8_ORBOL|nr:hypothetical protein TWF225_010551 [Orbilia oligospora]KAF3256969.1 hypothetical protein TWF128_005120 [Orbilia oligospora]TGJ74383.1 hypothetical protein EYR41_001392 [Orbilia oligospora]
MGKPWETYKQEIYRYYIEEGKPLAEVREILKAKYNFEACKRSYQNQIEVWGFKKNVRSADMRAYLEQKQQNIPDSEMGLSQDIIDKITPRKVRRYEKRYAGKSSPSREATSPRESRRLEEYENWESYDVDQHSLFDYPDSYPVTPSHGSEDHFYTGDMISNYPSYPDHRLSYSAATLGEPIYASTAEYSTMGSLTATDYGYRSSHDAHARYSPSGTPHTSTSVKQTADSIDLMKAALAGRYDGLRRLLMGGETPNVVDRDGNTSLHYLVRGFHKLLDRAAHSPGLLSGDRTVGSSEEFEERIAGFNACLNLLLSYGAMATPNERGDTAAQMASARLAEYTKDPYNAAAGTHKQWTQFVNSMSAATSEYTR